MTLRTETIGSFLRPPALLKARETFNEGDLVAIKQGPKPASLIALEDEAIREVVKLQEDAGLDVVTDGEFRRILYFEGFLGKIEGIAMKPIEGPTAGFVTGYSPPRTHVVGKLRWPEGGATVAEFEFLKKVTHRVPKITLPSPLHSLFYIDDSRVDRTVYPDLDEMWADLEDVYAREFEALARAGCTYVQLDETTIVRRSDPKQMEFLRSHGVDPDAQFERWIEILARVVRRKPAGMMLGIHICRGNGPKGGWFSSGGYEPIADALFNRIDADRYLLEYDTERAGDFAPLRHLRGHKVVVLGVVSTKDPTLEDAALIRSRIDEAARYTPLDNLALSPQCGFSSGVVDLPLTIDDEKRKLERIVQVAREVWKN